MTPNLSFNLSNCRTRENVHEKHEKARKGSGFRVFLDFWWGLRAFLLPFFVGALAFSTVSCAYRPALSSPTQLKELPVSKGKNGGSVFAETPWQYVGSNADTHEFVYYYNVENVLHDRRVSILRGAAVLHFKEMPVGAGSKWVTLHPGSTTFQFYPKGK